MTFPGLLLVITGGGAAILLASLGLLIVRRGFQEHRETADSASATAFRAALLPLIASGDKAQSALSAWRSDPIALDVCAHLLQLMRGAERGKLLGVVEGLGLLEPELTRLASARPLRRMAAIRRLGSFPSRPVADALVHRLRYDEASEVRLEAGLALVRLDFLPTVAKTLTALDDGGDFATPAHRIVFRGLARRRPHEMMAAWESHRHGPARFAIVDALGDVGDPSALCALREALRDADPQLRCEALRSMRRSGHPSVAGAVLAALCDPAWIVRVQAAATAGSMRLEGSRAALKGLTRDPHWWVRYRADEALANLRCAAAAA